MQSLIAMLSFFGLLFLTRSFVDSHTGMVDGYGCHRAPKNEGFHCHQGPYAGRSFKSREEFLRQLRKPNSNLPQPKTKPLPPENPWPRSMEDRIPP
jgi:hypothetical protein